MSRDRSREIRATGQSRGFSSVDNIELSVMLPTCNRVDALQRTLLALEKQSVSRDCFEVVVVDDGSTDSSAEALDSFAENTGLHFIYLLLKNNGGPARARNIGLSSCRGRIVLIIGDDIEPAEDLVEKHLLFHRQRTETGDALLGYVSFPPQLQSNAFMRWLETGGRKYFFNYAELSAGEEVGPMFFYTCNVSVKSALLEQGGWFDESFPYASHEDLELGCRLADKGMRLYYDPSAKGFHWHLLTVQGITRRVYLMGHSASLFWEKIRLRDGLLKRAARSGLAWFCAAPWGIFAWNRLSSRSYPDRRSFPVQWHILLFLSFFIGLADARKGRKVRI